MHMTPLSQARTIFRGLAAALILIGLTGCDVIILNLTPATVKENPSQIYTLSARVTPRSREIDRSAIEVKVVIDGQSHPMRRNPQAGDVYEYDYPLPEGRNDATYYYLINYTFKSSAEGKHREATTDLHHLTVLHRYVQPLVASRGPVGARISLIGRGFTPQDVVYLGSTPAHTVYESPNTISFFVPTIDPGRTHDTVVSGGGPTLPVGAFRVDATAVSVSPDALTLRSGESQSVSFTIGGVAPAGGLLLDVTTDIPESIIMPEVVVPQGMNHVEVSLQGGKPGSGSLFLRGFGPGELVIPVTVTDK